jgi:hypothetical protein
MPMPKEFSIPLDKNIFLKNNYSLYKELIEKKEEGFLGLGYHPFKESIFKELSSPFIIDKDNYYLHTTKLSLNFNNNFVQRKFMNFYEELVIPELSTYKSDLKMKNESFVILEQNSVLTSIDFKPKNNRFFFSNLNTFVGKNDISDLLFQNKMKDYSSFKKSIDYHYCIVSSAMDYLINFYNSPEPSLKLGLNNQNYYIASVDEEIIV